MDLEKFTERSRGFLQAAQTIAMRDAMINYCRTPMSKQVPLDGVLPRPLASRGDADRSDARSSAAVSREDRMPPVSVSMAASVMPRSRSCLITATSMFSSSTPNTASPSSGRTIASSALSAAAAAASSSRLATMRSLIPSIPLA